MWKDYLANTVIYYFGKIPLLGRVVTKASYRQRRTLHVCSILGIICRLIWAVIKTLLTVALFVVLPRFLFVRYSSVGADGFGLDNSYIFFTLVMICFGGSLNHSHLFDVTENSVTMLKTVKINPTHYFHGVLMEKLVMEFIGFWISYTVFGMHWYKAGYLALVVMLSRFVGETIQIQVFHISGKRLTDLKGATIFVSLLSVFCAYFIPYIKGCVPSAYNIIFETIWFIVIMVLASFFIYYIWNYNGYDELARLIHTRHYLMREMGEPLPKTEPVTATEITAGEKRQAKRHAVITRTGYRYQNWVFFRRNRTSIRHYIEVRGIVVAIALAIALISNLMGYGEMVYKVIVSSIPVTVFLMYIGTISGNVCKALFSQGDRYLLHYGYFRRTEDIMEHYTARLRMTILLNLIPTAFIMAAYAIAALTTGVGDVSLGIFYVCGCVLVYCFVFSFLHLTLYYLAEPYDQQVEVRNPWFIVMTILILVGCYGCIFIDTLPVYFLLGSVLLLAFVMALSITLIWKLAPRTFKVCRDKK